MIAAPELLGRYQNTTDSPEGVAVTRAAVDWRQVGMVRAAPVEALEATYIHYLNGRADPTRFERGLQWATTPLYAHVALLQGRDEYTPYDYVAAQENRAIPGETFETIVERFATGEELTIDVGVAALEGDDIERAEQAFRVGDRPAMTPSVPTTSVCCCTGARTSTAPKRRSRVLTGAASPPQRTCWACCSRRPVMSAGPKLRIGAPTNAATPPLRPTSPGC